jgi:hypothetical protein
VLLDHDRFQHDLESERARLREELAQVWSHNSDYESLYLIALYLGELAQAAQDTMSDGVLIRAHMIGISLIQGCLKAQ